MGCWEQLAWLLGWESTDPELAAVHFWTVAAYNLQHPAQYTEEAIAGLQASFRDVVSLGVSTGEIRRRNAQRYEGSARVRRPEAEHRPTLRPWSLTIADVYLPEQPEGAAARVRTWAETILGELKD